MDYDASNILVTLSLLGTTLIKGDVPAPAKQVQLNVAVSKLTAAINSGSLIVPVDVDKLTDVSWEPSLSWSYGSWIYNYLCNQCLSPLMLWVGVHGEVYSIQHYVINLSVTCDSLWFLSGYSCFLHRYSWNIVESGVKHHKPTNRSDQLALS